MATTEKAANAVNLRLPRNLIERAEALRRDGLRAPELAILPSVTRSDILRLAVLRGLDQLEEEYEAVVDAELARSAAERLSAPNDEARVPWEELRAESGL